MNYIYSLYNIMALNVITFINSLSPKSIDNIRISLFEKGINSSSMIDGRMIFHTSKSSRFNKINEKVVHDDTNTELWKECNGLILDCSDIDNIKPLVIPQYSFISHYDKNILQKFISDGLYDVYKIEDGTVINLYYYENNECWTISTNRGIDMNNCKFNDISYIKMLEDVLYKKNIEIDKFFESLNKETCYTFNIKHNSIHKFNNNEGINNNIWFLQSVHIPTLTRNNNLDIDYISEIKNQESTEYNEKIINKYSEKSINDYINKNNINLGYILKSKNPELTHIHSNILIESNLMRKIRQLLYNNKFIKMSNKFDIDRKSLTVIDAYLNINNSNLFINLFPEYKYMYDILHDMTNSQINNIMNYHVSQKFLYSNETINNISLYLYTGINKLYNINMINPLFINQIITNYLINSKNIDIYIDLYKLRNEL